MRLLIVGDVHGNYNFIDAAHRQAKDLNCDVIVQLGDFGLWDHYEEGVWFLDGIEEMLSMPMYWIDGNHENHERLNVVYDVADDGFRPIRKNLYHIPRGHVWEWDNKTFMGFGGAYSIDEDSRRPYVSWWPNEEASDIEVREAVKAAKTHNIDVLFTHDTASEIPLETHFFTKNQRFLRDIHKADLSRDKVSKVFNAAKPKYLFHGHYHLRYSERHEFSNGKVCRVEGIAADINPFWDAVTVLDTDDIV